MATGKRGVRGREEIMARCPGSGKRCVPQLLRRFKGLRADLARRPGDARGYGVQAGCWRLPWTEPDSTRYAGQQRSRWEIDLDISSMAKQSLVLGSSAGSARAETAAALGLRRLSHTPDALQHSALAGRHSTWDTRDCPHAYLAEDQAHWVLLSSGKASRAPAYGG